MHCASGVLKVGPAFCRRRVEKSSLDSHPTHRSNVIAIPTPPVPSLSGSISGSPRLKTASPPRSSSTAENSCCGYVFGLGWTHVEPSGRSKGRALTKKWPSLQIRSVLMPNGNRARSRWSLARFSISSLISTTPFSALSPIRARTRQATRSFVRAERSGMMADGSARSN